MCVNRSCLSLNYNNSTFKVARIEVYLLVLTVCCWLMCWELDSTITTTKHFGIYIYSTIPSSYRGHFKPSKFRIKKGLWISVFKVNFKFFKTYFLCPVIAYVFYYTRSQIPCQDSVLLLYLSTFNKLSKIFQCLWSILRITSLIL